MPVKQADERESVTDGASGNIRPQADHRPREEIISYEEARERVNPVPATLAPRNLLHKVRRVIHPKSP